MNGFIKRKANKKEFWQDILFPNRCPFCDGFIEWNRYCCDECYDTARLYTLETRNLICKKCGKYVCCCNDRKIYFDECYIVGEYDGMVREAVLALKYKNNFNSAVIFADRICDFLSEDENFDFDYVTAVPMNKKKLKIRGYNQAEVFGRNIADLIEVEYIDNILFHQYFLEEQHELSYEERQEMAEKSFYIGDINLKGKKILLCDDVMTTGATLNKCAELLKKTGAEKITLAVCAGTV